MKTFRRCGAALAVIAVLLHSQLPAASARSMSPARREAVAAVVRAPRGLALPAPARITPPPLVRAPKRSEVPAVARTHEGGGMRGPGVAATVHDSKHAPPDPHAQSAQRRAVTSSIVVAPHGRSVPAAPGRVGRRSSSVMGGSGCNATPSDVPVLSASDAGTGINPWWRYQEGPIPGVGRYMVNVATQNLLVQGDDMDVHNAGIDLAFRRTYNSLSLHDASGTDGATPSEVGNGWTSTFDAHLSGNVAGGLTVSDIDGARYDYTADGQGHWLPPAGQHGTLVTFDGGATYQWTKKSGSSYIFAGPSINHGNTYEGYNGRLLKISGRNANTYIALTYYWQCGDAASNENLAEIDASTQSGVTAKLYFASFAGHQLLSRLVWPDGVTTVTYSYDAAGNLVAVQKPPPDTSGGTTYESYMWSSSWLVMTSPRFNASNTAEGGYIAVMWASPARTVGGIQGVGVMNFAPPDGTNTLLQPNVATGQMQYSWMGVHNYAPGVNEFIDTDGHDNYYYFDGSNRVIGVAEWTGSLWLGNWFVWDASNDLTGEQDPRGNVTNYAYDAHGNTVAAAAPPPAAGAFRPTQLITYDSNDNVVAFCDPNATHSLGADWTSPPAAPAPGQGGLCPQTPIATQYQWSTSTAEPYGQLIAAVSPATAAAPTGYRRTFSYDAAQQSGTDYGLPTRVVGTAIAQNDAITPTRQPQQTFWYDQSGNLICYGTGNGQWILGYDALGRLTSAADPDDASSGVGVCGKSGAQPNWNTTVRTTYFPNGAIASKQSASQAANGISDTFTYDIDGNEAAETHYHGCVTVSGCSAGTTKKFYDGADRLVEVLLPYDGWDVQSYPWETRYIYDLSLGGTTPYRGMSLTGYGNLVATQELLSGATWRPLQTTNTISSATWMDVRATAFDALDRGVASYEAAFGDRPKEQRTYDAAQQAGLLSSVALATNEVRRYTYDGLGRQTDINYSGDGGVTPGTHVTLDADGRVLASTTDVLGTETIQYDAVGNVLSVTDPASVGGAVISYDYYADGMRLDLKYAAGAQSYSPLLQYAYRQDGNRERLQLNNGTAFQWAYTAAGREQSQRDPLTGTTIYPDATYDVSGNGRQAAYYPSSMTYVPRIWAYDTYGRLSHLGLPEAIGPSMSYDYPASQYDLEDSPIMETRNRYSQSTQGVGSNVAFQACLPTTIRNEQMPNPVMLPCASIVPTKKTYNGTQMTDAKSYDPHSTPAWLMDARAGMLLNDQYTSPNGNIVNAAYVHDASGRLTQDSEAQEPKCPAGDPYAGSNPNPYCFSNGTRQKTYDAENRLRSDVYSWANPNTSVTTSYGASLVGGYWALGYQPASIQSVDYDAASHPIRLVLYHPDYGGAPGANEVRAWLWDGNDRLLTCQLVNTQCSSPLFSLEGLGDYDPASGSLSVNDRNRAGLVVTSHSATAFRDWTDSMGGPFVARTGLSNNANDPCSTSAAYCTSQHDGKLIADGWALDNDIWQGVRTYDGTIGQWNSPDAFAGDVHDPMSQKPFMWNKNNPYEYSDPTGFLVKFEGDDKDTQQYHREQYNQAIEYFQDRRAFGAADSLIKLRDDPSFTVTLHTNDENDDSFDRNKNILNWDPSSGLSLEGSEVGRHTQSPAMGLVHEVAHALRFNKDPGGLNKDVETHSDGYGNLEERRVILGIESLTAGLIGEPMRFNHDFDKTCRTAGVSGTTCI